MQVLEKISVFVGKHMAVIVLVIAALSLFCPKTALWVQTGWINYLLMLVMFGMGLTLKTEDFKYVFQHPRNILLGCISQFTIMPLLAYGLGMAFQLDTALLAGVILVGTCPGGTSSNVITYLAGGDVALSVGMTSVNTLLAPLLTPAITYLFLHTSVDVDVWSMFLSVVQVVIIPIVLGLLVNRFLGRLTASFAKILPLVSVTAICLIVMAVVSHNAEKILTTGAIVFAVVILHNLLGYACGFGLGKLLRPDLQRHLREQRFPILLWLQSRAPSFLCGIIFQALCWRGSCSALPPNKCDIIFLYPVTGKGGNHGYIEYRSVHPE